MYEYQPRALLSQGPALSSNQRRKYDEKEKQVYGICTVENFPYHHA